MTHTDDWATYVRAHCRAHKYTATYTDWWLRHLRCEVPGCGLRSAAPHHIRSRGSGGDDNPVNLVALCTNHHTEIHQLGVGEFARRYPAMAAKIEAAHIYAVDPRHTLDLVGGRPGAGLDAPPVGFASEGKT